jgi:pilus assembly protein CpaE
MLVLNKASNRPGIRAEDVEKNIQRKISMQIGDAGQDMVFSINQGVPLMIGKPSHQVARDIGALAREVSTVAKPAAAKAAESPAAQQKQGGLFSRLIKR